MQTHQTDKESAVGYFLPRNRLGGILCKQEGSYWYVYDLWYNRWAYAAGLISSGSSDLESISEEEAFLWMMEHQ